MVIIADEEKPLAIAGIMGGQASGVTDSTSTIVLESACFEAASIRRTSTQLNIRTDASARFEKGLDPNLTQIALSKAIELIVSLCPGAYVASNSTDFYPTPLKPATITIPTTLFAQKLGVSFSPKLAATILERLGFGVKQKKDVFNITVPTWRSSKDIRLGEDIVEEVARIYGYDQIPGSLPETILEPPSTNLCRVWEQRLQDLAVYENSFFEVYNYSFVSSFQIRRLDDDIASYIELDNPLSKEKPFLRRNLLINLLDNLEKAGTEHGSLGLFEIGKVFLAEEPGMKVWVQSDELLPRQDTWFTAVYMQRKNKAPFWELRRFLERWGELHGLKWFLNKPASGAHWQHPYRSFALILGKEPLNL
jgi:phenylalanyl-tRNA synthetase beta chain